MSNLPTQAWLDTDGRHIWWRHQCIDGEHTDMLPWPNWKAANGYVTPSISCTKAGCGSHSIPIVGEAPEDFVLRQARE